MNYKLICFDNKFIFTHITKTGGVSVHNALKSKCDFRNTDRQHRKLVEDEKIILNIDSKDTLDNYFKFCVVRNPWERYVSQYFYRINARGSTDFFASLGTSFTKEKIKSVSFRDMLIRLHKKSFDKNNYQMNGLSIYDYHLGGGQLNWVKRKGLVVCDYFCRLENIQDDFDIVCDKIGIDKVKLGFLNKGKYEKPYYEYYDDETIEIVASHAKEDIERFGYKFGE